MKYKVKALDVFAEQIKKLDKDTKKLIHNKIELIKENPFRYKKLHSHKFSKVFRIRFSINSKAARLVYAVIEPNIILICILGRKSDYKFLEKHLKKLKGIKSKCK